jgi:adenosyl cobinamide kinase/adenosyl cobinamide phosphate guanylyltransferase
MIQMKGILEAALERITGEYVFVGIEPDVAVVADQALDLAYQDALSKIEQA